MQRVDAKPRNLGHQLVPVGLPTTLNGQSDGQDRSDTAPTSHVCLSSGADFPSPKGDATFDECYKKYETWAVTAATFFARKWRIDKEEAAQEARIALFEAHRRYDPQKGTFGAYAAWWIRHRLQRAVRQTFSVTCKQATSQLDAGMVRLLQETLPVTEHEDGQYVPVAEEYPDMEVLRQFGHTLHPDEPNYYQNYVIWMGRIENVPVVEIASTLRIGKTTVRQRHQSLMERFRVWYETR